MLDRFLEHNRHIQSENAFLTGDPQLLRYSQQKYKADFKVLHALPTDKPGIYTLSGGRQLGKSTCCKLLMARLLREKKTLPGNIAYLPCDSLIDRTDLYHVVKQFLRNIEKEYRAFLFIDEVTYVDDWQRSIKAIADEGLLHNVCCYISGSDRILLEDAAVSLPGRRGISAQQDFELRPLLFRELVHLLHPTKNPRNTDFPSLFASYLHTGGYITAVNDYARHGEILESTYRIYAEWVVGDFIRLRKSRHNLAEILYAIFETLGSQITFPRLAEKTDGVSTDTVQQYCEIFERLGVLTLLHAFDQSKKRAFPKKARKIHFQDPFIAQALWRFLHAEHRDARALDEANIVEGIALSHYARFYKTFYMKGDGEIDIVYLDQKHFHPVEVKWRNQVRGSDLEELRKYPERALVLTKEYEETHFGDIPGRSLVKELFGFDEK